MDLVVGVFLISLLMLVLLIPASVWRFIVWLGLVSLSLFVAYCSLHLILYEYNGV